MECSCRCLQIAVCPIQSACKLPAINFTTVLYGAACLAVWSQDTFSVRWALFISSVLGDSFRWGNSHDSAQNQLEDARFGHTGLPQKFSSERLEEHVTVQTPRCILSASDSEVCCVGFLGAGLGSCNTVPPAGWLIVTEMY